MCPVIYAKCGYNLCYLYRLLKIELLLLIIPRMLYIFSVNPIYARTCAQMGKSMYTFEIEMPVKQHRYSQTRIQDQHLFFYGIRKSYNVTILEAKHASDHKTQERQSDTNDVIPVYEHEHVCWWHVCVHIHII